MKNTNKSRSLSKREVQVLDMISQGNEYIEISKTLNISVDTIKFHTKNITKKINAKNIRHAIHIASKREII